MLSSVPAGRSALLIFFKANITLSAWLSAGSSVSGSSLAVWLSGAVLLLPCLGVLPVPSGASLSFAVGGSPLSPLVRAPLERRSLPIRHFLILTPVRVEPPSSGTHYPLC